jgi:hypothetical protein
MALLLICATRVSASDYGVNVIAQRGFGDPHNSYSWSMAWFRGKLYVGTARQEVCVEDLTVDYYLPVADVYKTNPLPSTHCSSNPDKLSLRAEIWQYTPQTGRWRMVYISPVVRNPHNRHRYVARDFAYRGMVVYRDAHGRPELYAGAVTLDEVLPQLARNHPPVLLRTTDGVHFTAAAAKNVIVHNPFGLSRPMGFRSMVVWKGKLYVTLTGGLTGDGEVYQVDKPWSNHPHFRVVTPPSLDIFEMHEFHGRLYIGTGARINGYGVYWSNGEGRRWRWHPVVTDGAGRGDVVTSVVSMQVYRGQLYVGSSGWYTANSLPVSELIRIRADGGWQVVAGNPRIVRGVLKAPISGLTDGFENIFAAHFWRMTNYGGGLYVGTNDWSWLLQEDTRNPWLQSVLSPEFGFDIWATCDGADWFPVTRDAFGNIDDFGARNFVGSPFGLFIGSADQAQGTTVWLDTDNPCAAFPHVHSATVARVPSSPQQLLTDVQPKGTVVSWVPSAGATRYVVYRASYTNRVSFSYDPPIGTFGGLLFDDTVPIPATPGSPGSVQTMLSIPTGWTPVGTTSNSYFVDRSAPQGVRVLYQVAAQGVTGAVSARSNVQVVPDPRPPATFGQLARDMGPTEAAFTADARSRMRRGGRRAELAIVKQVLRDRHLGPDAQELAYRLERRLQYAGVAGGP